MATAAPSTRPARKAQSAWFVITVLAIAGAVSFIDRQIINLLVDPIKLDLELTDASVSTLGIAFALLYTVLAIPLAWLADHSNRKWVIIGGLICWSAATFASGLAASFGFLFFARMMVGIGEATLAPAGMSILSDTVSKERLPTAISIFSGAGYVGSGLALGLGGIFYQEMLEMGPQELGFGTFSPWQMTFMAVSLLSVPVFFMLLAMREPPRREEEDTAIAEGWQSVFEATAFIWKHFGIFGPLMIGFSMFAAAQFGLNFWIPTYFIRVHEWTQLDVGTYFGPVVVITGLLGVVIGGLIAEKMLARGYRDATLLVPIGAALIGLPFAIVFPLVSSEWLSLSLIAVVMITGTVPFGAGVATFPLITPNHMRAQVIAIYLLFANLLGYALGPTFVGLLTDNVFNEDLIGYSLAIAPPVVMVLGIALIFLARGPYLRRADTEAAKTSS